MRRARYLAGADTSLEIESARECRCCPAIPTSTCAPARHAGLSTNYCMDHPVSSSNASKAELVYVDRRRDFGGKRPFVARQSGIDMNLWFPRPRQQFVETVDRMSVDHAREHITQVSIGFDTVEFAGFNQRADDRPTMPPSLPARAPPDWCPAQCDHRARSASDFPSARARNGSFGKRAAAGHAGKLHFEPGMQGLHDWLGERAPLSEPMGRRLPPHSRLNGIEIADPAQGFRRHGRTGALSDFVKLASRVCPTGREHDVAIAGQMLEARIAVDMQDTFEVRKVRYRAFGLAVRCEQIDRCRRFRSAPGPLVTGIDPQSPRLRSPSSRRRSRCFSRSNSAFVRRAFASVRTLRQRMNVVSVRRCFAQ